MRNVMIRNKLKFEKIKLKIYGNLKKRYFQAFFTYKKMNIAIEYETLLQYRIY